MHTPAPTRHCTSRLAEAGSALPGSLAGAPPPASGETREPAPLAGLGAGLGLAGIDDAAAVLADPPRVSRFPQFGSFGR